jgi:NACalpha-BTF3-like transcription factor
MKLPREVAAMAKQMGIDMSEMGGQAENMWSMLNDMSQNDPQAYEEFIKEQMEGAQEEAEEVSGHASWGAVGFVCGMGWWVASLGHVTVISL